MPVSVAKKPRFVQALQLVRQGINEEPGQGSGLDKRLLKESEHRFLHRFLAHRRVKHVLELVDTLTLGPQFDPRVTALRPDSPEDRDSLQVLSDLWVELERFVMKTREDEQPDAHELYDLLADPHIREVLVAYDDVANARFVPEDLDQISLYMESEIRPESQARTPSPTSSVVSESRELSLHEEPKTEPDAPRPDRSARHKPSAYEKSDHPQSVSKLINRFEAVHRQSDDSRLPDRQPARAAGHTGKLHSSKSNQLPSRDEDSWGSVTSLTLERDMASDLATASNLDEARRPTADAKATTKPPRSSAIRKPDPNDRPASPSSHGRASKSQPARKPSRPMESSVPPQYDSASLPNRSQRRSHPSRDVDDTMASNPAFHSLGSRRTSRTSTRPNRGQPGQTRRVRLRRDRPGEPIGITIALRTPSPPATGAAESGVNGTRSPVLAIQRVMAGSLADREGSLFPGDVLLEFNGRPVRSLDEVYAHMKQSSSVLDCEFLVCTPKNEGMLSPGLHNRTQSQTKRYIRTFFDYDARLDPLMPTGDVGLSFKAGEVLELMDDHDPNWWQVRRVDDPNGRARLIPSQTLEERRTAFKQDTTQNSMTKFFKRKYKTFFRASNASELRLRADLWSYEEVVPWPQSSVPCLLLLGVTGVGRRNLKVLLSNTEPNRFAFPMTCTTDQSASTGHFQIVSKSQMEADVRAGAYVEWGKANGHYYGIQFKAIRKIIATGRTVVLDCLPQTVHLLHQPEFNPLVVFIGAPDVPAAKRMMEDGLRAGVTTVKRTDAELNDMVQESQRFAQSNRHLYFHSLVNANMQDTVHRLIRLVTRIERQPSWIPSGWAYELSVPYGSLPGSTYVPGSSSLSALGIHGLPPARLSTASNIARSVLSGISEASVESARRLAHPPASIILASPTSREPHGTTGLYERRQRRSHFDFRPMSPAIPEQETPSETVTSRSTTDVSRRGGIKVLPTSPRPATRTRSAGDRSKRLSAESPTEPTQSIHRAGPSPAAPPNASAAAHSKRSSQAPHSSSSKPSQPVAAAEPISSSDTSSESEEEAVNDSGTDAI